MTLLFTSKFFHSRGILNNGTIGIGMAKELVMAQIAARRVTPEEMQKELHKT
jgi:hypothetical protein